MNIAVNQEIIEKVKTPDKKPEVMAAQKLNVRYHIEHPPVEDRPRLFLQAFAAILKHSNYRHVLDHYLRVSAKCSRCTASCQVYLATGDPHDIPCYRSELLLSVYRRHFTPGGMTYGRMTGRGFLTDEKIQEMADSFYNCTACRRCMNNCPMGIDHGMITHLGRYILAEIDISPRALVVSTREQLEGKTRNTSAIPLPALIDTLEFLEEDLEEETGQQIKFPMDVEESEYVFFAPVSDYMMEAETLMGIAAVFHATGDSWTVGKKFYDSINYGLFMSDWHLQKIEQEIDKETRRLKGNKILIGECGHATRSAKEFIPTFTGGKNALPVVNIMEYTANAIKTGKLKLRPGTITDRVTYHDPCNIARKGLIIEQPRTMIKAFCSDFVEQRYHGEDGVCCGGGGGTVSLDEDRPFRTSVAGKMKAEMIRETGAKYCFAPCANCKKQLRELMEDQKVDCQIVGIHDLLYTAIIWPDKD